MPAIRRAAAERAVVLRTASSTWSRAWARNICVTWRPAVSPGGNSP